MEEKRNFVLDCEICDARKMREDRFKDYAGVRINTEFLLLNERSQKILDAYPIELHVENTILTEEDVDFQEQNGSFTIAKGTALPRPTWLCVNGNLEIEPGTEEILSSYVGILVNGSVTCPRSLMPRLTRLSVNGVTQVYSDGCIRLKKTAVLDRYFGLRVKPKARYYAAKKVVMLDDSLDVEALAAENISFETKKALVAERFVRAAVPMFDESTEFEVVADGCSYVPGDAVLDAAFIKKNGSRIYVDGSLRLEEGCTSLLPQIEKLYVNGDVELAGEQKDAFLEVDAVYRKLQEQKGDLILGQLKVTVDRAMFAAHPEGICLKGCVSVKIDEAVTPEQILERLHAVGCVEILCSEAQRSAVIAVSRGVTEIHTGTEKKTGETAERRNESRIRAEKYIL